MAAKISVAMCTYNGARFLPEQLASIAAQTRLPDELVVCDDRSKDETVKVVEEFAARAPFAVRLFVNEQNLGSTKNFERAITLCEGDIIALCDQDDVWLPEKLRRSEEALAPEDVGLVFADAEVVDENLRPMNQRLWDAILFNEARQQYFRDGHAFDFLLGVGNVATGATMSFKSKYRELCLPVPPNDKYIHDGWIAVMIAAVARLVMIAEPLVLYRQHPGQQLGVNWKAYDMSQFEMDKDAGPLGHLVSAAKREHPFAQEVHKHRVVYERLKERQHRFDCRASLAHVRPKLAHLEARTSLPENKLRRIPVVLRELVSLHYHRYASGLRSAAKDLLVK